jgi:hypothetical protein
MLQLRRNYFDDKILLQRLQTTKFSASMIWHAIMILKNPWATPLDIKGKYDFLENESIVSKLLEFEEHGYCSQFSIPHIHCSSCIWILENLQRLQKE